MKFGLVIFKKKFTNRKAFIVEEKQVMTFKVKMNETIQQLNHKKIKKSLMRHSKGHYNLKLCAKVQRENEKATKQ